MRRRWTVLLLLAILALSVTLAGCMVRVPVDAPEGRVLFLGYEEVREDGEWAAGAFEARVDGRVRGVVLSCASVSDDHSPKTSAETRAALDFVTRAAGRGPTACPDGGPHAVASAFESTWELDDLTAFLRRVREGGADDLAARDPLPAPPAPAARFTFAKHDGNRVLVAGARTLEDAPIADLRELTRVALHANGEPVRVVDSSDWS